ncbi:hypothetical protein [Galbitalea soli]|uniref:Asparagine synthase n=1 Tax=Galbitalea soli TaxID=1268042 RepID=A0A7C9TRC9_9MICO|nr:hypothetical protein [Galbitalea soli]NEM91400.1 hypothetical protein [Galbitalea soli]NYJ30093.1 hypothetical protein [Galbitalea soli]
MRRVRLPRRRERRLITGTFVAPPKAEPITVERSVEEGLLIAQSALVLDVKNQIIVAALRHGDDFDAALTRQVVRTELLTLSTEYRESADRLAGLAAHALTVRARGGGEPYGPADHPTLMKRAEVSRRMADTLRERSTDDDYCAQICERARQRAWEDVGDAIEARLDRLVRLDAPREDPDYPARRAERIATFLALDLGPLLHDA